MNSRQKGTKFFLDNITQIDLIDFIIGLQDAVDGLSKNNKSFVKAYKEMLQKESERDK